MAVNIPDLYRDVLMKLRGGEVEETRNGAAKVMQQPSLFSVRQPTQRVLFDPERKANPYFHVMETVWMLAGRDDVDWLKQFNSGIAQYADFGVINGAYGHRWRKSWHFDQVLRIIEELRLNPSSRQLNLQMWNPYWDNPQQKFNDRPCNTNIYFQRRKDGRLDMTVCNRSNDAIWGMAGANAVHMTYLHELVASATGLDLGTYWVMSNNLHIYEQHWPLLDSIAVYDEYLEGHINPYPILNTERSETYEGLVAECERFILENDFMPTNNWLKHVAFPMREAYLIRKDGGSEGRWIEQIRASDWRKACIYWAQWHNKG